MTQLVLYFRKINLARMSGMKRTGKACGMESSGNVILIIKTINKMRSEGEALRIDGKRGVWKRFCSREATWLDDRA